MLVIFWKGSQTTHYPYVSLRDNDPAGFHPNTKERHLNLASIDLENNICGFEVGQDKIQLSWLHGGYIAEFTPSWLYHNQLGKKATDPF